MLKLRNLLATIQRRNPPQIPNTLITFLGASNIRSYPTSSCAPQEEALRLPLTLPVFIFTVPRKSPVHIAISFSPTKALPFVLPSFSLCLEKLSLNSLFISLSVVWTICNKVEKKNTGAFILYNAK